jgi:predicted metal-dependent phosphoesterase TrpH
LTKLTHPAVPTNRVDLHTHSTASDGLLTPAGLVAEAGRRAIGVLALTDHDTLAGLPDALAAARTHGIELIPGVELSAEEGPHEVHILGYFVDPGDRALATALAERAHQRQQRAERIVERLGALGMPIAFDRVSRIASGGTIGRPHVARAMIESGYVASVAEAFDRFLANGKPAFVSRRKSSPEESVRLLVSSGAVPVLAHPFSTGDIAGILRRLVPRGLAGIEVYYGEYAPEQRNRLREIADEWALIPTGGSDYHGPNFKAGRELGSAPVPLECAQRLRLRWESAASLPSRS